MEASKVIRLDQTTAVDIAQAIYRGFRDYRSAYLAITAEAQKRFEDARWLDVQRAGSERLQIYHRFVADVMQDAPEIATGNQVEGWPYIKAAYNDIIDGTPDVELAETFFNSVYREHTDDGPTNADEMFVLRGPAVHSPPQRNFIRTFKPSEDLGVVPMVKEVLHLFAFNLPWLDMDTDVANILRSLAEERTEISSASEITLEVISVPFFRNKAAYVIGKLLHREQSWPVALPILRTSDGQLYVDTLICDTDEMSVMFSFTRSYFFVDNTEAAALVEFLHTLLPNKKLSELYASIGLHKHGKTEFYRGFMAHLDQSDDEFVIAPGIKGMVMAVFTLPSYQTVFKIIKDRFAPQKNITRAEVKEKYHVVKNHDRVGRMADTQEFENFRFPKSRFSRELLEELYTVCRSQVYEEGDELIIRHLYVERQMIPLNLYIENCTDAELTNALDEYGNAIGQLAAANIFPGDMLLKNFGITRHGRVVFYDYDEISYLTDVNFREIPQAQTPEQEMASEPWYSVAPNDVFPEEFRRFLFGRRQIKRLFTELHGNLFEAEFWRSLQQNIDHGEVSNVFPYRRKKRFSQRS